MNDNVLYEIVVEKNHIDLIIKALSNYMCAQYEGIDLEVVDVPVTIENIKIASDMQLVLKHQLGTTRHTPKQTSETTGLIWCKEVFAVQEIPQPFEPFNGEGLQDSQQSQPLRKSDEQRQKELNDSVEYAKYCLDTFLKNQHQPKESSGILSKAWNNVKERHWDTIKRMGEK